MKLLKDTSLMKLLLVCLFSILVLSYHAFGVPVETVDWDPDSSATTPCNSI